ncbi:phosphate signaling complex protein PhoU [Caulobacter segnis]|uniref:phosphate signaling complex protein PhoU n=1 Tax=Caulobacter segnis TaxID=88688 RepID=UPI00241097E5|nr:phosphate signaling complex protein PhoU [Caulobacter segnis]MDG2523658.1 phosphate signaling complex protein PhoU [Caulobacter segnis]
MEHTVTAFENELTELTDGVIALGVLAQSQLDDALSSIFQGDAKLAQRAIKRDPALDTLAIDIERKSVRMIALRQPMADDLRRPIAAMKIAMNLERCGDLAKNVAKRTLKIGPAGAVSFAAPVERMGRLVAARLGAVLNAYGARNVTQAVDVWTQDAEIDEHYEQLFAGLLARMAEDPESITACTHLLFIAKNLERIGDHATNIAELIHYEITGVELVEDRPKFDA